MKEKDRELKNILSPLVVPPCSDTARERARSRALAAFRNGCHVMPASVETGFSFIRSVLTGAVVAVSVIFLVFSSCLFRVKDSENAKLFSEIEKLFPGQIIAAIQDGKSLDFELLKNPQETPSDQRIILTLKRDGRRIRVLTYSGREVCLNLNGRYTCLEVLATENGDVILAQRGFVWSREIPGLLDGYQIEAKMLPPTS